MAILYSITGWDRAVFAALNNGLKCAALDRLMPLVTDLGLGWVQALAVLLIALAAGIAKREIRQPRDLLSVLSRRRAWMAPLLIAFVISGLGSDAIKAVVPRERPWWYYEQEHAARRQLSERALTVPGVYPLKVHGFPSGHTATSVAMAMTVTLLFARRLGRRWLISAAWSLTAVIALSRIYLASHWPLDVVGGAVIGVFSALAAQALCRAWARRTSTQTKELDGMNRIDRITDEATP